MEVFERDVAPAFGTFDLDDRAERHERHAEVGGVRRDTGVAPSQDGVEPRQAFLRITAAAGFSAIAGAGDIVEILAARALQDIAAGRRGVAQLCGSPRQQRFGDARKGLREARLVGQVAVSHQRADTDAAVVAPFDRIEAIEMGDVDDPIRTDDVAFHEIEQVGAAGEVSRTGHRGSGDGLGDRGGADIIEWLHAAFSDVSLAPVTRRPWASRIASVMPA